ncbi:helix-turn-helix domain-containing protein [Bremerella cremea]|uniref:helix-turn-helix domain-containing protein n=1 Tax=Bremerella cremea TaxID=1031537 RepID=UPI0031F0EFCA
MSRRIRNSRNRLQSHQIAEVHRLRAAGHTHMEIKRQTGISRTTIHLILHGQHSSSHAQENNEPIDDSTPFFDGPIERCPRCGRRVHMPCMPCRISSMVDSGQLERSETDDRDRRQRGQW